VNRLRISLALLAGLFATSIFAQQSSPALKAADSSTLDFKQFGLLAIQDGGRRKPIDTFGAETLIRVTGRSSYTD
jgi:hypothetical protein